MNLPETLSSAKPLPFPPEKRISSRSKCSFDNPGSSLNATLQLYNFDTGTSTFVGGPAYSTLITAAANKVARQNFVVNPNATVVPGNKMAVIVNWGGPVASGIGGYYRTNNYYTGGDMILANGRIVSHKPSLAQTWLLSSTSARPPNLPRAWCSPPQ